MRLAALLAELPVEQIERLAAEHLGPDENVSPAALCTTLETVLRSYSFVRRFVGNRLPPTFAILETLLETDGWTHSASSFRNVVTERTQALVERVKSGDLVGRESSLRLYRRVLLEARKNDIALDASESALLGVLRRELGIRAVEHFVIEHHPDFHEFWAKREAFLDEMHALRSSGLVFGHDGNVMLAEEVVPLVRRVLGFDMPVANRRRIVSRLSGGDLAEVLGRCELKTSGTKEEKLERLLAGYIQPTEVLRGLSLQTLRDLCRDLNASVSGSKDELVERLVEHVLHDLDIRPLSDSPEAPKREPEPRVLDEQRFRALFASLRGDDLTDILTDIDSSRVTGAKETKISLLFYSTFSETSLLAKLTNRALEETLGRHQLRTAGSKRERVNRLVEYYRAMPEILDADSQSATIVRTEMTGGHIAAPTSDDPSSKQR
jgi:hypothetical protein